MNPYFLLGILILMMIIGHLIIRHIDTKEEKQFNEFYNEIYNTCENDASFGYLSEYTIFKCEKEKASKR